MMKSVAQQGIFLLIAFLLSGCGFLGDEQDSFPKPYELNPEAICTNSSVDEWTLLGLRDESPRSILVHPQNPHVIFVGTGFDFSTQRDGKIFRSTDCGQTWDKVYEGGSFRGLLLHPKNPYTLFAWDNRPTGGLLRSTDGGDTWKLHSDGMHTDGTNLTSVVLIHPDKSNIMYAGTSGFGSGALYKSTNGGKRWESITMNHWPHLAGGGAAMFMHPEQPELLLHSADFFGTLSRSTDGGETWDSVFSAGRAVRAFAMNPSNPDQIVGSISRLGLLISEDKGNEWRVETISDSVDLYYDVNFIRNNLYIATAKGVVRTNDLKNYQQVGSQVLGLNSEGDTLYFPRNVRVIVSDTHQQNLYMGHNRMLFEGEIIGGVYVRKLGQ